MISAQYWCIQKVVKDIKLDVAYMGTVMFPFFFNRSIQYSRLFLYRTFFVFVSSGFSVSVYTS